MTPPSCLTLIRPVFLDSNAEKAFLNLKMLSSGMKSAILTPNKRGTRIKRKFLSLKSLIFNNDIISIILDNTVLEFGRNLFPTGEKMSFTVGKIFLTPKRDNYASKVFLCFFPRCCLRLLHLRSLVERPPELNQLSTLKITCRPAWVIIGNISSLTSCSHLAGRTKL